MDNDRNKIESRLLTVTHEFLQELKAERAIQAISLDASLERDLGIDSLGRVELFHRIEKEFAIQLPESTITQADSLYDLANIIEQASKSSKLKTQPQPFSPIPSSIELDLSSAATLTDVLMMHAKNEPNRPHLYLQDEDGTEHIIRYKLLLDEAKNIAKGLHQREIQAGETIAIMLPTSDEFFYTFLGILLAGAIPVPIYPPFRSDLIEEYTKRQAKILNNAQIRILVTFSRAKALSNIFQSFIPSLKEVTTVKNLQASAVDLPNITIEPQDIAFLQYTSGSTGDPKGVVLTHANILANIRAIGNAIHIKPTDVGISWLPLYHDMGLMSWLVSLYYGIPATLLSPITFLNRPEKWLWAIHYHRGTLSGGPNFAYELCIKSIRPEEIEGLDLSSWRFAFNGSEAVNPKTLESFSQKFSPYGFKIESFAPSYGLAEATVALTVPTKRRVPRVDKVRRDKFEKENKATPETSTNDKDFFAFVACGEVIPDHTLRIVDDNGIKLDERNIGNIQFQGPSAMQGYFNNPVITQKNYHDGWWDTGDLGYLADNDLFITGRKKDIIIKGGRHLFPEGIEDIVNQITSIRKGCVVAFGVSDPTTGTEKIVVVAETAVKNKENQTIIQTEIINRLSISLGMPPDAVLLVPPDTIPKTLSGKLQRSACKQLYIEGKLIKHQLPIKLQLAKLTLISIGKKLYTWLNSFIKFLYAIYIGLLVAVTLPFVWLSLFSLKRKSAAKVVKYWARNLFRAAGCPINIDGIENLKNGEPIIFVANHTSYIDSLLLLAVLPPDIAFTPKKELLKTPIIGSFIKQLNYITIDRLDFAKSLENVNQIKKAIQQKRSIVIFPEGTFTYATGLRPFKLGAFSIAAETQTPICPVATQGTRLILRGDNIFPKPGKIKVTIGAPIYPRGNEWEEIIRLHSLVRTEIAKHCGESAIDIVVAGPT